MDPVWRWRANCQRLAPPLISAATWRIYSGPGGKDSGSGWFYESILSPPPMIVLDKPGLGMQSDQFVFDVVGPAGQEAVVETSSDLSTWTPLQTNSFLSGQARFTNAAASTTPFGAFRARVR